MLDTEKVWQVLLGQVGFTQAFDTPEKLKLARETFVDALPTVLAEHLGKKAEVLTVLECRGAMAKHYCDVDLSAKQALIENPQFANGGMVQQTILDTERAVEQEIANEYERTLGALKSGAVLLDPIVFAVVQWLQTLSESGLITEETTVSELLMIQPACILQV